MTKPVWSKLLLQIVGITDHTAMTVLADSPGPSEGEWLRRLVECVDRPVGAGEARFARRAARHDIIMPLGAPGSSVAAAGASRRFSRQVTPPGAGEGPDIGPDL